MDDLQAHCDHLELENRYLRDRLSSMMEAARPVEMFPRFFGLTVTEERFLTTLLNLELATKGQIYAALYAGEVFGGAKPKIIDVLACKVRKKLQSFDIEFETVWGRGYQMSEANKAAFRTLCRLKTRRAA